MSIQKLCFTKTCLLSMIANLVQRCYKLKIINVTNLNLLLLSYAKWCLFIFFIFKASFQLASEKCFCLATNYGSYNYGSEKSRMISIYKKNNGKCYSVLFVEGFFVLLLFFNRKRDHPANLSFMEYSKS